MTKFKQLLIIKCGMTVNAISWLVYGLYIELYPITAFNCLTIVLSVASIIRFAVQMKKEKNKTETEEPLNEN